MPTNTRARATPHTASNPYYTVEEEEGVRVRFFLLHRIDCTILMAESAPASAREFPLKTPSSKSADLPLWKTRLVRELDLWIAGRMGTLSKTIYKSNTRVKVDSRQKNIYNSVYCVHICASKNDNICSLKCVLRTSLCFNGIYKKFSTR